MIGRYRNMVLRSCKCWASAIILLCTTLPVLSQNLEQTLAFADQQLEMGHPKIAIQAYKRIIFFKTDDFRENVFSRLADAYYQTSEFKDAAKYYDLAYAYEKNDSLKNEFILKGAFCQLIEQEYSKSLLELHAIQTGLTTEQRRKKNFYLGIAYFGNDEFEKSEEHFKSCLEEESEKEQVEALFTEIRKIKLNPKTAKTLSIILPGLGQFYAGDIKNGLNSLILTGGLATLFVFSASKFTVFDASISIVPWFLRYYIGGFNKAEEIAQSKLNAKRNVIYKQIIDIIANPAQDK